MTKNTQLPEIMADLASFHVRRHTKAECFLTQISP